MLIKAFDHLLVLAGGSSCDEQQQKKEGGVHGGECRFELTGIRQDVLLFKGFGVFSKMRKPFSTDDDKREKMPW